MTPENKEERWNKVDTFMSLATVIHLYTGGDIDRVRKVLRLFGDYLKFSPDLNEKQEIIKYLSPPKPVGNRRKRIS